MKNTLKVLAVTAVVLSALCFGNCFASAIDSVEENMDTQVITVSGSNLIAGDKVLIEIFNYDNKVVDYDNGLEGIVAATVDEDGSYTVEFKPPKRINSGIKMVIVKPLVGKHEEKILDFYSSTSISTILLNWNDAVNNQDKTKMEAVINDETALKIILNSELVPLLRSELLNKNKDTLTAELLKLSVAERIDDFADDFISPYINFAINNLCADTASKLIVEFYDNVDTLKGEVFKNIISNMPDDERIQLFKDGVSKIKEALSNEAITKIIYETAVFNEFNKISYYKDVKKFIDLYNEEYFKIDFDVYDSLESTYNVDSKVLSNRNEYSDFDTFKEKYEEWIEEQYESENDSKETVSRPSGSGGSSSKRGTSSGGGGAVVVVEETVFDDIKDFEWAKEHIMSLYNKGVVDGVSKKEFAPSQTVTREQFVKMASALCDLPETVPDAGFEDVQKGAWYEKYINCAKGIGLVSGQSEAAFGVGQNITRQDAAMILFNAIKLSKPDALEGLELKELQFKDSGEVSSYAMYAVSVLNNLGVLNGDDNGYVMPLSNATRAEAAVMINKVLNLIN